MTEEEKYLLEDLNYSFADGFSRGYNRGFLDGIHMLANIYEDKKMLKKMGMEDIDETK